MARRGPKRKLTDEQVAEIRDSLHLFSKAYLAKRFGVSLSTINNAIDEKGAYKAVLKDREVDE